MHEFARRTTDDRAAYFSEAAARRSVQAWMMEKDFWVCWLLHELFQLEPLHDHLVFKGGTSLSKVLGVIRRFSEDIDLSVSPQLLGIEENWLEDAPNPTQLEKRKKKLEAACIAAVHERFGPLLTAAITARLGTPSAEGWILEERLDDTSQSPTLVFRYPAAARYGGYVRAEVKIEFGSLTDQRPTGSHTVTPMVAEEFPTAFSHARVPVVALEAERTFWEKATILHAEYHRHEGLPMRERYSRHYYDLAALALHPLGRQSLLRLDLLARVVRHKSRFFASAWASYNTARPGTLRLVPPPFRLKELEADYAVMAEMFMGAAPSFAHVLETLRAAEAEINAQGAAPPP
jgi:hypothetical protein